jgi:hypothetical protein
MEIKTRKGNSSLGFQHQSTTPDKWKTEPHKKLGEMMLAGSCVRECGSSTKNRKNGQITRAMTNLDEST